MTTEGLDMSLILCPECGSKMSDKARTCPHCGFQGEDCTLPVSAQSQYEVTPMFKYDIEEWNPNRGDLSVISYEDNKTLLDHFGNWDTIKIKLPAIAEAISSLAAKDHVMVAKMPQYVKELIDKGVYRFTLDKQGNILPTISGPEGFVRQVRLEDMSFSPNLVNSLNNLSTHAAMAQILDEIEYVGDAIREIHIELQNDRLALAESARDKLKQAIKIQDAKLREIALLNVISSSCDAKRTLMRNFAQNRQFIAEHSNKFVFQYVFDKTSRDVGQKAVDALQSLVFITNAVQTECEGYGFLGEYEACKESLLSFKDFVEANELDKKDTLLMLNESASNKQENIVNEFKMIAQKIAAFDPRQLGWSENNLSLLTGVSGGE